MQEVEFSPLPLDRFEGILDAERYREFARVMERAAECFRGRTLWSINSAARGGGVAEMLTSIMGYVAGADIDARWLVIEGDDEFFALTKRIHNRLHGESGDGESLEEADRRTYERCLEPSARELKDRVGGDDVVLVHDPQPAGLIPVAGATGATVVWRCHIGVDDPNKTVRETWEFLRPYVTEADATVFSRRAYVWSGLNGLAEVIMPSIDAFSSKNQTLDPPAVSAILRRAGVVAEPSDGRPEYVRADGTRAAVDREAVMVEDEPVPPSAPLVAQVSRWDRLKDPVGVLRGFAEHVAGGTDAHLLLAGPRVEGVTDDPEEEKAFGEVDQARRDLPGDERARVHLALLPIEDDEENSAIVNALQRRADVVVQKSLAEGFGLTVAEAMWKGKPVVAAKVGGIQDQIVHDECGLLIEDPADLSAFGESVTQLLEDPERSDRLGRAAHERVSGEFLPSRHLRQYVELLARWRP